MMSCCAALTPTAWPKVWNKLVDACIRGNIVAKEEQLEKHVTLMETVVHVPEEILPQNFHAIRREELMRKLLDLTIDHYEERGSKLDELVEQNPGMGIPTI